MISAIYTWVATLVALVGTVLNCKKIKACFYLWTATNIMWLAYDLYLGTVSRAVLDAVQLALAIYGIYEWTKLDRRQAATDEETK